MSHESVVLNYATSGYRYETLKKKKYLVAPMVMITVGVHNGSVGPIYYPEGPLSKLPKVWNTKPIVVYHPADGDTAARVDNLETSQVGMVMNTRWDAEAGKLRAEAWLDEAEVARIDNRVLDAIYEGRMMEVSTGVFVEVENKEGVWNGENYVAVACTLGPDHLAILPDQKGACSIADGAGLLQLNAEKHENLLALLKSAISEEIDDLAEIISVRRKSLVYTWNKSCFELPYTVEDKEVTLDFNKEQEVLKVTQFVPLRNSSYEPQSPKRKEVDMNKAQLIDALIANKATKWEETDREFLDGLDENQLQKLEPVVAKNNEDGEEPAPAAPAAPTPEPQKKPVTMADYINNAPAEMRDSLIAMNESHNRLRENAITAILNKEGCSFTKEELSGFKLPQLEKLAQLAGVEAKPAPQYDYAGAGGFVSNGSQGGDAPKVQPLEPPKMSFAS